jgi:plasmid stabilization system protein ParE
MKILFKESFLIRFDKQIEYISLDSPKRARKFKNDVLNRINEIPQNPYKYRKSIYFENISIRDLVFKGYTIVFRIHENQIQIFGFVKHRESPTD